MNPALWTEPQRAAAEMVDALVTSLTVPDNVYANARAHFGEGELIEIALLTGLYTSVAMMVGLIRPRFDRYREGPVFQAAP